jgi:hypothetical protein
MSKDNTIGKSPIKSLFAELLKLDIEIDNLPDESGDDDLIEVRNRQWAVAAQIDTTLARNLGELSNKNRAMQLMAERSRPARRRRAASISTIWRHGSTAGARRRLGNLLRCPAGPDLAHSFQNARGALQSQSRAFCT